MSLPDPIITEHDGFKVVRDDLLPGGTKRRAIAALFDEHETYAYASPVFGYAQVALAYAARDHGKKAVIFCAKRGVKHALTLEAAAAGATIYEVEHGYMTVVKARAREYCHYHGWSLLPFGLDTPVFVQAIAAVARALPVQPSEVWSAMGSGCLSRALQMAWPEAHVVGVRVGAEPDAGRATMFQAPEKYESPARVLPPFPSCTNYDAKCWAFMKTHASPGALFWNVGK